MTQDELILLLLKIGLLAGFASIALWTAVYSALARWWENPVGRTLVIEAALIAGLFVPQILSLFFQLNRLDSRIAAWTDVALIGLVTPTMCWRALVWVKLSRGGNAEAAGDGAAPREDVKP